MERINVHFAKKKKNAILQGNLMQVYLFSIFYITTTTNLTDLLSKYHQLGHVQPVLGKELYQTPKWKELHY